MRRAPPGLWKKHKKIYADPESVDFARFIAQSQKISRDLNIPFLDVIRQGVKMQNDELSDSEVNEIVNYIEKLVFKQGAR